MEDDKGLKPQEIACYPVLMDMVYAVCMNMTPLHFHYNREDTKAILPEIKGDNGCNRKKNGGRNRNMILLATSVAKMLTNTIFYMYAILLNYSRH